MCLLRLQDAAVALTSTDATVDPAYRLRHVGLAGTLTCLILVYRLIGHPDSHERSARVSVGK